MNSKDFSGKWIRFAEQIPFKPQKTKIFLVVNKDNDSPIAMIRWYGAFRQYSFFPLTSTVYEKQCLCDIAEFLKILMEERKLGRQRLLITL